MSRALTDWPVWLQILGAVAVVLAVGVLAGPGWALLAAGAAVLAAGVLAEVVKTAQAPTARAPRPRAEARS